MDSARMPVSFYYGDEAYLLQQAVQHLRQQVVNPQLGGLGYRLLVNPSIGALLEAVGSVYFNLGASILIEIQDFAFLHKAASDPLDEKQLVELMKLIEDQADPQSVSGSKHLLFVNAKANRTVKFCKWLTTNKTLKIDCQEWKTLGFWQTEEAVQQLLQLCRERKIVIERSAAFCLVASQGVSFLPLMNEVEKLSTYMAGKPITIEAVNRLSNISDNVFNMLADWVHERNRAAIFQTLEEILLRQHPVQLFAVTHTWLGNIVQLHYYRQRGLNENQIAELTHKHPFKIRKDGEAFGSISWTRLEKLQTLLNDMEEKAKTGQLAPHLAYEMLMAS